jgi:hypothetical protein
MTSVDLTPPAFLTVVNIRHPNLGGPARVSLWMLSLVVGCANQF